MVAYLMRVARYSSAPDPRSGRLAAPLGGRPARPARGGWRPSSWPTATTRWSPRCPSERRWLVRRRAPRGAQPRGSRDAERVLAWCDVPAFPVSRARLERVHGGARGVALARALARPGRECARRCPTWCCASSSGSGSTRPSAPALDLADYRPAWLGVRAPAYRPKGRGRARPAGLARARDLLAGVLDLGGWAPRPDGDDWERPPRRRPPRRALLRLRGPAPGARGGRGDRRRPRAPATSPFPPTRTCAARVELTRRPPRRRGGHRARRPADA